MKGATATHRQDGQTLVLVVLSMFVLIAFAGLAIDVGRWYLAQRQLQTAADAAALAAGEALPNAPNGVSAAQAYGATGSNGLTGFGITSPTMSVTFECYKLAPGDTSGSCPTDSSNDATPCKPTGANTPVPANAGCNAVNVQESGTVKMSFLGHYISSLPISASATASMKGSGPVNVYVILDTTGSMTSSCSGTVSGISHPDDLDCAKAGVQALLETVDPCTSTCGAASSYTPPELGANVASPDIKVGLLVFPALSDPSSSSLDDEIDCDSTGNLFDVTYPAWTSYTYDTNSKDNYGLPASDEQSGYQVVGLSSDYRTSDTIASDASGLNSNSDIVQAVYWDGNKCDGYPGGDYFGLKDIAGVGSYLAGAITEAQYLLQQNARPGTANAIVVLSDGQLNNPHDKDSSLQNDTTPCESAVSAAQQAKAAGTSIYTIAYGDSYQSNATTQNPGSEGSCDVDYTGYGAMQTIASTNTSTHTYFYDEPTQNGDLTTYFEAIGGDLSGSRLLPDCATIATTGCS